MVHGGFGRPPHSESTACVVPTSDLKWFCTRMKSNDEGTNTTAFALCTADFITEGSSYMLSLSKNTFTNAERACLRV